MMLDNCMNCGADNLYETLEGLTICTECGASHDMHGGTWCVTKRNTLEAIYYEAIPDEVEDEE